MPPYAERQRAKSDRLEQLKQHTHTHTDTMSDSLTHVLFENASGYALFEVTLQEEVAAKTKAIQEAILDFSKFSRMVKLKSYLPFTSAAEALANANDISEGESRL